MSIDSFFEERKVKSNDIVNGIARRDIYDTKGMLLVKEGMRIREMHYQRMREQGLIQEEVQQKKSSHAQKQDINFVNPNSVHARLDRAIMNFGHFQQALVNDQLDRAMEEAQAISKTLIEVSEENIYQVLGELYLSETSKYHVIKPLYIAASVHQLMQRFNRYKPEQAINEDRQKLLVIAAMLTNIGLLINGKLINEAGPQMDFEQRRELKTTYPKKSAEMLRSIGITDQAIIDAVSTHMDTVENGALEYLILRTPVIYANLALVLGDGGQKSANPCKKFAQLYAAKEVDPLMGGLFLKINGMIPVGAMVIFSTREKAIVVKGPEEGDILSSEARMLTDRSTIQLGKPGDRINLSKTKLEQQGLADHHQFAWNKFSPFAMWEK